MYIKYIKPHYELHFWSLLFLFFLGGDSITKALHNFFICFSLIVSYTQSLNKSIIPKMYTSQWAKIWIKSVLVQCKTRYVLCYGLLFIIYLQMVDDVCNHLLHFPNSFSLDTFSPSYSPMSFTYSASSYTSCTFPIFVSLQFIVFFTCLTLALFDFSTNHVQTPKWWQLHCKSVI